MRSTFAGLELGKRALSAQQLALDTTGHNISNSGTTGYTRQIANLTATIPDPVALLGHIQSVGTGAIVDSISRARDIYIDRQFRWETSKQQYWTERQDCLQSVEGIMNEPSDNSLHSDLDKFWTAWSDLATNPENLGARAVVRERAIALTDSFHRISQQLTDLQNDLESSVNVQINQVNDYAEQIKDLNEQIRLSEVNGDTPNDLYDQRDNLVDELSKIVSVRVTESLDTSFTDRKVGIFRVDIGAETTPAQTLVNDSQVWELQGVLNAGTGFTDSLQLSGPLGSATPTTTTFDAGINMGSLQSNIDMRDTYLTGILGQFDDLAAGIIDSVNSLHQTTTLGTNLTNNFFDSAAVNRTAAGIQLDTTILTSSNNIIAGEYNPGIPEGSKGDGTIASKIASLANDWSALTTVPAALSTATSIGDYYSGAIIAVLGVDVQQAERMTASEDVLVNQISNQRDSVSGVSLDEEMTNLVKFQKSYAAAARMITIMDDMLDKIVNGMGVTR